MLDMKLFMAFLPDRPFACALEKANPYLVALFLNKEDYLQEIIYEGNHCYGKLLSNMATLSQIEDMEKHLISLLTRLAPHYRFDENPPRLIAVAS